VQPQIPRVGHPGIDEPREPEVAAGASSPPAESVVVITFEWPAADGVQPVLYLDRKWLH
jgi:hypothetical protein